MGRARLHERGPEARRFIGALGARARHHPESHRALARADAAGRIVKSNGRIEATQVDVSSKYPGRLSEVTVEEGSTSPKGKLIAKITSPEYEAQLRAANADVQKANDALATAEAEITSGESALEFAKSDLERGQELMKTGFITKQVFEQRKRNFDSAAAG